MSATGIGFLLLMIAVALCIAAVVRRSKGLALVGAGLVVMSGAYAVGLLLVISRMD